MTANILTIGHNLIINSMTNRVKIFFTFSSHTEYVRRGGIDSPHSLIDSDFDEISSICDPPKCLNLDKSYVLIAWKYYSHAFYSWFRVSLSNQDRRFPITMDELNFTQCFFSRQTCQLLTLNIQIRQKKWTTNIDRSRRIYSCREVGVCARVRVCRCTEISKISILRIWEIYHAIKRRV